LDWPSRLGSAGNPGNSGAAATPTSYNNIAVSSRNVYNVTVGAGASPGAVTISWPRQ
jgi:hypothetical protein